MPALLCNAMQAGFAVAGSLGELRPTLPPCNTKQSITNIVGGNGATFGSFPPVFITTPPPQAAFATREA